jgi:small GTP-binding protein
MTWTKRLKTKVCLVGEQMVGKTSLVRRCVQNEFDDRYITTLGVKTSKKELTLQFPGGGRMEVHLAIWDFMGQEGFRELLKDAYFIGARGILAVADVTRRPTLESLGPWIETVRSVAGNVPLVLAINKADLSGQAVYSDEEISRFAATYDAPFIRTSAKTGANVEAAFGRLATAVAQRYVDLP